MRVSESVKRRVGNPGASIWIALLLVAAHPAPAQDVHSQTLIYAAYDGEDNAGQVFKTMKANQTATGEKILSYAIVSKDINGKTRVRDQRKKDAKVGAVLGGVIGVLGGPAGVVAGAAAGGSVGYLTGDQVGISKDTVDRMKAALTPNSSALVVVLDDRWVQDVAKGLKEAQAREVISEAISSDAKKPVVPAPKATPSPS